MSLRGLLAVAGFIAYLPFAHADTDLDALLLADNTKDREESVRRYFKGFVEAGWQHSMPSNRLAPRNDRRFSLSLDIDKRFSRAWRVVASTRVDRTWVNGESEQTREVNTLKEAYVSWQPSASVNLDLGRVNVHHGAARGYNPTDYFRTNSLRSIGSIDPDSLKSNRLGTVLLRGQTYWAGGSAAILVSPKITSIRSGSPYSLDLGATNNELRWLLSTAGNATESTSWQFLVFDGQYKSAQFGVLVNTLMGDSTVGYLEWSGGRSRSQFAQIGLSADAVKFHHRMSAGATHTWRNKLSVSLEYSYNGAAPDSGQWQQLQNASLTEFAAYRGRVAAQQELVTRGLVGLYARWPDAFIERLDLNAFAQFDTTDASRQLWLELRYRWERADLALQIQTNQGRSRSNFGAYPDRQSARFLFRLFF